MKENKKHTQRQEQCWAVSAVSGISGAPIRSDISDRGTRYFLFCFFVPDRFSGTFFSKTPGTVTLTIGEDIGNIRYRYPISATHRQSGAIALTVIMCGIGSEISTATRPIFPIQSTERDVPIFCGSDYIVLFLLLCY